MSYSHKKAFLVRTSGQLRALHAPGRLEVVEALLQRSPLSAAEVAAFVGGRPAAVHYHLAALTKIGLVQSCGVRSTGRRPAMLFRLVHREIRLAGRSGDPQYQRERARSVRLMLGRAAKELAAAHDAKHRGRPRPRLAREVVRLDAAACAGLERRLAELEQFLRASEIASGGRRVAITIAIAPIGEKSAKQRKNR